MANAVESPKLLEEKLRKLEDSRRLLEEQLCLNANEIKTFKAVLHRRISQTKKSEQLQQNSEDDDTLTSDKLCDMSSQENNSVKQRARETDLIVDEFHSTDSNETQPLNIETNKNLLEHNDVGISSNVELKRPLFQEDGNSPCHETRKLKKEVRFQQEGYDENIKKICDGLNFVEKELKRFKKDCIQLCSMQEKQKTLAEGREQRYDELKTLLKEKDEQILLLIENTQRQKANSNKKTQELHDQLHTKNEIISNLKNRAKDLNNYFADPPQQRHALNDEFKGKDEVILELTNKLKNLQNVHNAEQLLVASKNTEIKNLKLNIKNIAASRLNDGIEIASLSAKIKYQTEEITREHNENSMLLLEMKNLQERREEVEMTNKKLQSKQEWLIRLVRTRIGYLINTINANNRNCFGFKKRNVSRRKVIGDILSIRDDFNFELTKRLQSEKYEEIATKTAIFRNSI